MHLKTLEWIPDSESGLVPGRIRMIDQTRLPTELAFIETSDVREVWTAIKTLQVRGAPAIGVAAAMGMVAAIQDVEAEDGHDLTLEIRKAGAYLRTSRPTAVNLFWAVDRMMSRAEQHADMAVADLKDMLAREAVTIGEEDAAMCRAIGMHGVSLLQDAASVLTHCNAGSLATARFGTALAPVYMAHEQGRDLHVFVDETRPLLQGARLTAWELMQEGVPTTLICDHTAGQVMREGNVDAVLVGADRIAGNGDSANKIGTYSLAVLARAHDIPFYVLAPTSTFDLATSTGGQIPIEQRDASEVTHGLGRQTAPEGVDVYAPAFDVTPARLITAIVCQHGIARPPYEESLKKYAALASLSEERV